jgi:hypothetical protein
MRAVDREVRTLGDAVLLDAADFLHRERHAVGRQPSPVRQQQAVHGPADEADDRPAGRGGIAPGQVARVEAQQRHGRVAEVGHHDPLEERVLFTGQELEQQVVVRDAVMVGAAGAPRQQAGFRHAVEVGRIHGIGGREAAARQRGQLLGGADDPRRPRPVFAVRPEGRREREERVERTVQRRRTHSPVGRGECGIVERERHVVPVEGARHDRRPRGRREQHEARTRTVAAAGQRAQETLAAAPARRAVHRHVEGAAGGPAGALDREAAPVEWHDAALRGLEALEVAASHDGQCVQRGQALEAGDIEAGRGPQRAIGGRAGGGAQGLPREAAQRTG